MKTSNWFMSIAFGIALAACGGGGGNDSPTPTPTTLTVTGTVATGTALAGATVTLTDSKGVTKTATTTAAGKYTIDVTGLTPPFVIKATGIQGGVSITLVSVSKVVVTTINVTPLTTVIAAKLSPTGFAKDLNPVSDQARIISLLATEEAFVDAAIKTALTDAGLVATDSLITTPFDADGTGYDSIYDGLQIGQSSTGDIFFGPKCTPAIVKINGHCTEYSNPSEQTTTNPNLCGFDIASGAGIPCDPTQPITSAPSVALPTANADGTVSVGGAGISFGTADTVPPTNSFTLIVVACTAGTNNCTSTKPPSVVLPAGFPTNVSAGSYVISGSVCVSATGYSLPCTQLPSQTVQNSDPTAFANTVVSAFQAGAASAASSGCSQSQTYTPFNGSSFSGTFTATCTSGTASASTTVKLTITKQ